MPSSLAHAAAGIGVAALVAPQTVPRRFWMCAALCAVAPDLDYIGVPFGNRSIELWFGGHRGFTHSLAFAMLLGSAVAWLVFREGMWHGWRARLALAFSLATATHGVLDALSTLGPGVAFFFPFSSARHTFDWRPIHPTGGVVGVLANELVWVEIPALTLFLIAWRARRLGVNAPARANTS